MVSSLGDYLCNYIVMQIAVYLKSEALTHALDIVTNQWMCGSPMRRSSSCWVKKNGKFGPPPRKNSFNKSN